MSVWSECETIFTQQVGKYILPDITVSGVEKSVNDGINGKLFRIVTI